MQTKIITALAASLVGLALSIQPVGAAEDHKAEAMKHITAAVEAGKKGDAPGVGTHAEAAKPHVEAANKEKANPHLEMSGKSLDSAIEHSKMGHADIAGKAAEEAATHLKAAE